MSSLRPLIFFFASRRRHTRFDCDWSSDVCSSDLVARGRVWPAAVAALAFAAPVAVAVLSLPAAAGPPSVESTRSEERRVGKECRSGRWAEVSHEKTRAEQLEGTRSGDCTGVV